MTEEHPRSWVAKGGGGFEGGLEALRASTFSGEGMVQMLCDYRDYLREIEKERESVAINEAKECLSAARQCLNRWGARYAASEHAKHHKKETNMLIERIDEWLLRQ